MIQQCDRNNRDESRRFVYFNGLTKLEKLFIYCRTQLEADWNGSIHVYDVYKMQRSIILVLSRPHHQYPLIVQMWDQIGIPIIARFQANMEPAEVQLHVQNQKLRVNGRVSGCKYLYCTCSRQCGNTPHNVFALLVHVCTSPSTSCTIMCYSVQCVLTLLLVFEYELKMYTNTVNSVHWDSFSSSTVWHL